MCHNLDNPPPPATMTTIPGFYRNKEDSARAFVEQACLIGPGLKATTAELLGPYDDWRQARWDAGEKAGVPLGAIGLGRALSAIGTPKVRINGKTVFRGIAPR